ncbi:unnamed protein product [Musa textilis]
MAAGTAVKPMPIAEGLPLSLPAAFFSSVPSSSLLLFPLSSKPLRFPCLSLSSSLLSFRKILPLPPFVAQTSGWTLQEEEEENELEDGGFGLEGLEGETADGVEPYGEPAEEAKLFVGNLPYDMDSEKLAQLFDRAGVVEVAEVIYNRGTDQSRGFGFVSMSTIEEADKAVEMFHRSEISGRLLTVNKAAPRGRRVERTPRQFEPSFRIYAGNLPWQVDDSRLGQIFSEHGKVLEARVVYDRETGRSRGFGFVKMAARSEMDDAIAALDGQMVAVKDSAISENGTERTLYPYVTGTSVIGMKYKDGVILAADMGGSYGSTLRYKSVERIKHIGKHSLLGASGEISDFQEILRYLDELILYDNMWDDGNSLGPKEVHNYLTRVMYNRRNKFNPLWNSLVLGGVKNGQKYLGMVGMIGTHFEDNHVATGFGNHLARPILRAEWREDLSFEEAVKLLEKCLLVLLYRDRSAINKFQIAKITEEGVTISQPYALKTYWGFSAFQNPSKGAEGSW